MCCIGGGSVAHGVRGTVLGDASTLHTAAEDGVHLVRPARLRTLRREEVMLTRPAGFGRTKTAFVFDNGTTVLDAPDGGEIRIRSFDDDDALLAHLR